VIATAIHSTIGEDNPRVRRDDPVSSHRAADSITADGLAESQAFVLVTLREFGPLPAWRIERYTFGEWSGSRVRTALVELEEKGLVVCYDDLARNAKDSQFVNLYEAVS